MQSSLLKNIRVFEWHGWLLATAQYSREEFSPTLWYSANIDVPFEVKNAVVKRQAEFLAGRLLIQQLQKILMVEQLPIKVSKGRSPIWPSGFQGSISHSSGHVWCGYSAQVKRSLGLDVERVIDDSLVDTIASQCLTHSERNFLSIEPSKIQLNYTIAFASKEALYKALFRDCQKIMDFKDVCVVDISENQLVLQLTTDWSQKWRSGDTILVDYWVGSKFVRVACEVEMRNDN
ncbi:4'-phosphopantetheinyl transferase family protein [Ningiella sp. W23]|uniref:4'-phosphopantetheinyl transferase family protein n=1 Tax=Ningiella sp. W23 TaxID=3023715 RepID=UPI00375793D3